MGTSDSADETGETDEDTGGDPSPRPADARSAVGHLEAAPRRRDDANPRVPVTAWRGVMPWRRVR